RATPTPTLEATARSPKKSASRRARRTSSADDKRSTSHVHSSIARGPDAGRPGLEAPTCANARPTPLVHVRTRGANVWPARCSVVSVLSREENRACVECCRLRSLCLGRRLGLLFVVSFSFPISCADESEELAHSAGQRGQARAGWGGGARPRRVRCPF